MHHRAKLAVFGLVLAVAADDGRQMTCGELKSMYQQASLQAGGNGCCGNEDKSLDLPECNVAAAGGAAALQNPVLNRVVTPRKTGGNTYAGAVHGNIIYYPNNVRTSPALAAQSKDVALFAYNTTSEQVQWKLLYSQILPPALASTLPPTAVFSFRNTPFVDAAHNLLWISDCDYLNFVIAVDMTTGAVSNLVFIPSSALPIDPVAAAGRLPRIRTGVVVEYEMEEGLEVPMLYFGRGMLYNTYVLPNYYSPTDVHVPGTFRPAGFMCKHRGDTGEKEWVVNTMPEELTAASGIIPSEVFRPGASTVQVLVEFQDGYVFEDAATYTTSGTRELWDNVNKRTLSFVFADGDVFSVAQNYTAVTGEVVLGANMVWSDAAIPTYSHITKELKPGFDLTGHPWEAYWLNYYGGNPWAQGAVYIDGDNVVFGTGNTAQVPLDEANLYIDSNTIHDTQEYATGMIPIEGVYAKYMARRAYQKSPRGYRAWFNAIVSLDKATGAPTGIVQTTPYDNAHNGYWGGYENPYDVDKTGQPNGEPYKLIESSDMDIGVGFVKFNDGKLGVFNKASFGFVFTPSAGVVEAAVPGDLFMDKGVKPSTLVEMTTADPVHVGLWSWVGGVNYGISTSGTHMFGVARNTGGTNEHLSKPELVTPSYGMFNVPTGVPYMVSVSKEGTVDWVTPLHGATGVSATAYHNGKVYTTMFQDNDDNFVYEITTDDRNVVNRRGIVFVLDAETGKILHRGRSVAGALWAPQVISDDKVYTFNGAGRSFIAAYGVANVVEKFHFK